MMKLDTPTTSAKGVAGSMSWLWHGGPGGGRNFRRIDACAPDGAEVGHRGFNNEQKRVAPVLTMTKYSVVLSKCHLCPRKEITARTKRLCARRLQSVS